MADIKIKVEILPQGTTPTFVFASRADTPGATGNFKKPIGWSIQKEGNVMYMKKNSPESVGTKTYTFTGIGWNGEKLSMPKQVVTRLSDEELFLNQSSKHSLSVNSGVLTFKFKDDFVGLTSNDNIKLVKNMGYSLVDNTVNFQCNLLKIVNGKPKIVADVSVGKYPYTFNGGSGVFEVVPFQKQLTPNVHVDDLKKNRLMSSKHIIEKSAYEHSGYFIYNKRSLVIELLDNDFCFHGVGDFANYYKAKTIKSKNIHMLPSINTSFVFSGCYNLQFGLKTFNLQNATSLVGFASGTKSMKGDVKVTKWFTPINATDISFMFEYSKYKPSQIMHSSGKFIIPPFNPKNVTKMESVFEGTTEFDTNLQGWQIQKVTSFRNMFKNSKAFISPLWKWKNRIGGDISVNDVDMQGMFENSVFNEGISKWDVSKVSNFKNTFKNSQYSKSLEWAKTFDDAKITDLTEFLTNTKINHWSLKKYDCRFQYLNGFDKIFGDSLPTNSLANISNAVKYYYGLITINPCGNSGPPGVPGNDFTPTPTFTKTPTYTPTPTQTLTPTHTHTPSPTPTCENNALKVNTGWNKSTTYSHPGHSNNMAGTNNKSFNNSSYNGRGFLHPSCENKNKIFDGDWNTHSGDYWAANYGAVVWEKIHVGETGCGTFRVKLAKRRPGNNNSEIFADVSILYRKPGQTWTGTKADHYFHNQNSGGVRVWTTQKGWEGFISTKIYDLTFNVTDGIEEILIIAWNRHSVTPNSGFRIYGVETNLGVCPTPTPTQTPTPTETPTQTPTPTQTLTPTQTPTSINDSGLFFNGGYAYTMPSKPNGSYSQSMGGGISGYVNSGAQNKGSLSVWFKPTQIPNDHNLKTHPENGRMYLLTRRHHNAYTANWSISFNFEKGLHFYQHSLGSGTSSVNQFFGGNIIEDEWNHIMVTNNGYHVGTYDLYSTLSFYVNGELVGTKTTGQVKDHRYAAMVIGAWQSTYSNGYNTGHTRPGNAGVNYSQFWRAIPSAHSNTANRFYGIMKQILSTENSVPNATHVNTLYHSGLEGLLDSGYNPVRTYWEMDEVKINGNVHGLTLGQYVDGVTARRSGNYNKASKIVLSSSGVTGLSN